MKYKVKTKMVNGVEKVDARSHSQDKRKMVYLVMNEKGQTKEVDKKWIVEHIADIANLGLSGASLYVCKEEKFKFNIQKNIKSVEKSNNAVKPIRQTQKYCSIFFRWKFEGEITTKCILYKGSINDLVTVLNLRYKNVKCEYKNFFNTSGAVISISTGEDTLSLYVTVIETNSSDIFSCFIEIMTGRTRGVDEYSRVYHKIITNKEEATVWLESLIKQGKNIVLNYVGKESLEINEYNSCMWFYSEFLCNGSYKEWGASSNTSAGQKGGYVRADINCFNSQLKDNIYGEHYDIYTVFTTIEELSKSFDRYFDRDSDCF